jgi:hypothetical protein
MMHESSGWSAARAYAAEAGKAPAERERWQPRRDDAYRLAHQARAAGEAAAREPPPVGVVAAKIISAAIELETWSMPSRRWPPRSTRASNPRRWPATCGGG